MMTDREKRLLFLLIGALFVVLNFLAFKQFYQSQKETLDQRVSAAETGLSRAQAVLKQRDLWNRAEDWLARSEGKAVPYQTAEANLQSYVNREAKKRGLVIVKEDILPWQDGNHYNRVRVRCKVTGMEQQIQQWILSLRQNRQLQVITKFNIRPVRGDLTKADCEIEIEKYVLKPTDNPPS